MPLLVQHHDGEGGDRLGHGTDAEECIGAHGLCGLAVGHALGFQPGDAAMSHDQCDGPGDAFVVDILLDDRPDSFQPGRRESEFFGLGARQALGERAKGQRDEGDQENRHTASKLHLTRPPGTISEQPSITINARSVESLIGGWHLAVCRPSVSRSIGRWSAAKGRPRALVLTRGGGFGFSGRLRGAQLFLHHSPEALTGLPVLKERRERIIPGEDVGVNARREAAEILQDGFRFGGRGAGGRDFPATGTTPSKSEAVLQYLSGFAPSIHSDVFSWDDPLPAFFEYWKTRKRFWGMMQKKLSAPQAAAKAKAASAS